MPQTINKTALDIEKAHERGIIHRDYISHVLRWNFVLRFAKRGMRILDVGCGNGMLAQVLYSNKYKPEIYVGLDIRESALDKMIKRKTNFEKLGLIRDIRYSSSWPDADYWSDYFDLTICFEVIEHFEVQHIDNVLAAICRMMKPGSILLLSTPNYNGKDKAANHVHEYREGELEGFLGHYFIIERKIGTFASQKDIIPAMSGSEEYIFNLLKQWFDSNVLSIIFASLHPSQSRNILWICRKPEGNFIKNRQLSLR